MIDSIKILTHTHSLYAQLLLKLVCKRKRKAKEKKHTYVRVCQLSAAVIDISMTE